MSVLKIKEYLNFKDILNKSKWILSHSKYVLPFLIFTTIVSSLSSLLGVYNTLLSKWLIDSAINGNTSKVIKYLIIMISLTILNMLVSPILSLVRTHSSTKLNQSIQKEVFEHLEDSDWLSQSKYHSVSLLSRITSDVSNISSTLLSTIPDIISILVTLIASLTTLIYLSPSIALLALFIGPLLIMISRYFSRKLSTLYKKSQEIDIKYRTFIQEVIQNLLIVKTFGMEKINSIKLVKIQKEKYDIAIKNTKLSSFTGVSLSFCSNIAYFSIFCLGIINISKGVGTYGTFTAMLQLYSKIQSPFSSLASLFPGLIAALAAADRLIEIEAIPLEKSLQTTNYQFKTPDIVLKDLSFEYKKDCKILNNINLSISHGEIIALVGSSGEGKTTLIRIILSLLYPCSGHAYFEENTNLVEINKNCRKLISYVPQGNTLFSGTIEENLRYGNYSASEEQLFAALKNACAYDFVEKLDYGIKTLIGEKSLGISEGQSQRISIARAFLRAKPILILDEATSSLDPQTEVNVLHSIKNLSYKPTCIIITHRPSALNICNKIYKLKNGNLEEVSKQSILKASSEIINI